MLRIERCPMELYFLGTGTSHGIPVIGCGCRVCTSPDPRDIRFRSSALIRGRDGEQVLIDCGPEFRLQAIRANIVSLDALLLTHAHADHLHGLDDVRPLTRNKVLPIFANESTFAEVQERFSYLFKDTQVGGGKARIQAQILTKPTIIGSLRITPIPILHGRLPILGWLIEEDTTRFAYLTDLSSLSPEAEKNLKGLDVLVVGALRKRVHPTHLSFDQAFDMAHKLRSRRTFLTHLCHDHLHTEIQNICSEWEEGMEEKGLRMQPAWDGLVVRLP